MSTSIKKRVSAGLTSVLRGMIVAGAAVVAVATAPGVAHASDQGDDLPRGFTWFASSGHYIQDGFATASNAWTARAIFQTDGNLVLYKTTNGDRRACWGSNTAGRGYKMSYQTDGNLVIYNSAGAAIWATNVFNGDKFHLSKTSFPWTTTFYFKAGDKTVASC